MKDEIIEKIFNDYKVFVHQRDLFFKNVACYVSSDSYTHLDEGLRNVITFANKSDEELLQLAYKKNYELIDLEKEHIYVCLGSFIKSSNVLFPDFLVPHDDSRVDYTDYAELIGTPTRVRIPIEDREQFENDYRIMYLKDNDPYRVYYDLRDEYLFNAVKSLVEINKTR